MLHAANFSANAEYQACFTPGEDCTGEIVSALDAAKNSILVQAYSFTSHPIAGALARAKHRGVEVRIILDNTSGTKDVFSTKTKEYLIDNGIPIRLDYKVSIAHNKVMIIDGKTVVTGSFNFTRAAQERNAENLLIIKDEALAKLYTQHWKERAKESYPAEANDKSMQHRSNQSYSSQGNRDDAGKDLQKFARLIKAFLR